MARTQTAPIAAEIHQLIQEQRGEFRPGFARENEWGGYDYGWPMSNTVRVWLDDNHLHVTTLSGHGVMGADAAFVGMSADVIVAIVDAYL